MGLQRDDVYPQKGNAQENEDPLGHIRFENRTDPRQCDTDNNEQCDGPRALTADPRGRCPDGFNNLLAHDTPLSRTDWRPRTRVDSLNNLIRPQQQRRRDGEAERFGGLEVDGEVELRGTLDGEVGGLGTAQDPTCVHAATSTCAPYRYIVGSVRFIAISPISVLDARVRGFDKTMRASACLLCAASKAPSKSLALFISSA